MRFLRKSPNFWANDLLRIVAGIVLPSVCSRALSTAAINLLFGLLLARLLNLIFGILFLPRTLSIFRSYMEKSCVCGATDVNEVIAVLFAYSSLTALTLPDPLSLYYRCILLSLDPGVTPSGFEETFSLVTRTPRETMQRCFRCHIVSPPGALSQKFFGSYLLEMWL